MSADKYSETHRGQQCLAIEAQLFDYVDSYLSATEMRALTAHLEGCETCRLEVEHIRSAEIALAAAPLSIPAPGDLYAGFADKLAARQSKASLARLLRMRYVAPALGMAVLALFIFRPVYQNPTQATINLPSNRPAHDSAASKPAGSDLSRKPQLTANPKSVHDVKSNLNQLRFAVTNIFTGTDLHAVASNNRASGRFVEARVRSRRMPGEHPGELALAWAVELREANRKAPIEVEGVTAKAVMKKDHLPEQLADMAKVETIHDAVASVRKDNQANEYASTLEQRDDRAAALGARGYSYADSSAVHTAGAGFALIVQDDVRGFTAEAHNSTSSALPTLRAGSSEDDGVKVEVEFDGPVGTSSF